MLVYQRVTELTTQLGWNSSSCASQDLTVGLAGKLSSMDRSV